MMSFLLAKCLELEIQSDCYVYTLITKLFFNLNSYLVFRFQAPLQRKDLCSWQLNGFQKLLMRKKEQSLSRNNLHGKSLMLPTILGKLLKGNRTCIACVKQTELMHTIGGNKYKNQNVSNQLSVVFNVIVNNVCL